MELVKKNIISIVCGVVALLAVVAWFWPVGPMFDELQEKLEASKQKYQQVQSLHKQPRQLPTLVLEPGEERRSLDYFPNPAVIKVGQEKTAKLTDQKDRMLDTVTKLNKHTELVEGSLPRPQGGVGLTFVDEYLTELGHGPRGWEDGLPKKLNATQPPIPEEIKEIAATIWERDFRQRLYRIGASDNYQKVSAEFQDAILDLDEIERRKRADTHRIYLDYNSLPVSQSIRRDPARADQPPDAPTIWFAQTALWITQDVVEAINAANAGSKSVKTSPIKHLVALRVPFGPDQYVLASRALQQASPTGEPVAPPQDANGVPVAFTVSPTGRVCNDLYDVIHFDLVLRVDFRKIPQIIAELERNRLFTVLSSSVAAVDAAEEQRVNGYVYGNDPVAELTLQCEALFLRSWTVDKDNNYAKALMPEIVMQTVGAKAGPGMSGSGSYAPGAGPYPSGAVDPATEGFMDQ